MTNEYELLCLAETITKKKINKTKYIASLIHTKYQNHIENDIEIL